MADAAAAPRLELRMSGTNAEATLALLSALAGVSDAHARDEDGVVVFDCRAESPELADALARAALASGRLLSLEIKHPTLEDRFIAAVTQSHAAPP